MEQKQTNEPIERSEKAEGLLRHLAHLFLPTRLLLDFGMVDSVVSLQRVTQQGQLKRL
jgi:hypothetical protein